MKYINAKFPVDILTERLTNDKINKYSAYYWWGSSGFLQNKLSLSLVRLMSLDFRRSGVVDAHGIPESMKELGPENKDKNTLFLYHSKEGSFTSLVGAIDWVMLGLWGGWLFLPNASYLLLPALIQLCFLPRRWATLKYFCWHARLHPDEEEVWLIRSTLGGLNVIYKVPVEDLERVQRDDRVVNPIFWDINKFDDNLIFRDKASGEIFVFDKTGVWNEDTLKHPLIY
jgi:hypothetical protein